MNNQQAFDNALFGIRNQSYKQSITSNGESCAYRGKNNLKCGVGHSIPDELYKPEMEDKTSDNLLSEHIEIQEFFKNTDFELLRKIQMVHDNQLGDNGTSYFEHGMKQIANIYGLVYTEPSKELV